MRTISLRLSSSIIPSSIQCCVSSLQWSGITTLSDREGVVEWLKTDASLLVVGESGGEVRDALDGLDDSANVLPGDNTTGL